jgi:hypothetical protein
VAHDLAYVAGTVGGLGNEYVLGLKAVNCESGDMLAQEQVTAASKEKVLDGACGWPSVAGGTKKRAIIATARNLAVLLHRLWVSGEVYEPLRNSDQKRCRAAA